MLIVRVLTYCVLHAVCCLVFGFDVRYLLPVICYPLSAALSNVLVIFTFLFVVLVVDFVVVSYFSAMHMFMPRVYVAIVFLRFLFISLLLLSLIFGCFILFPLLFLH